MKTTNNSRVPIGLEGWRVDVGYPEDRDRAEALLRGEDPITVEE